MIIVDFPLVDNLQFSRESGFSMAAETPLNKKTQFVMQKTYEN